MGRRADDIPPPPPVVQRVVLLGYMASGKSTVGAALARRLEWSFLDFDVEIEQREGPTVKELIESVGETGFREREAALTVEAAAATRLVMSPGGGWITRPELLGMLGAETLRVWLRVSVDETVHRLREDTIARPFKELADPTPMIAQMLAEREPLYRLADISIPADTRSVESIAFEIEQMVRTRAGCAAQV